MSDPYEVLGISRQANDTEIRQRYLALVREFPPDRTPERFAAIRAAYDEVRDPENRLRRLLFPSHSNDTFDTLTADVRARLRKGPFPAAALLALAESSDDA
jgi:curved DNA-binding protein CbpA